MLNNYLSSIILRLHGLTSRCRSISRAGTARSGNESLAHLRHLGLYSARRRSIFSARGAVRRRMRRRVCDALATGATGRTAPARAAHAARRGAGGSARGSFFRSRAPTREGRQQSRLRGAARDRHDQRPAIYSAIGRSCGSPRAKDSAETAGKLGQSCPAPGREVDAGLGADCSHQQALTGVEGPSLRKRTVRKENTD